MNFLRFHLGILSASAFFAPESGGGGGGNRPNPTLEQQLESARADLQAAQTQIGTLTGERDTARTDLQAAQTQIGTLTSERDTARTDLQAAQTQIGTLTSERDTARTDLQAAQANVTRLEALCRVKGISPNAAVPLETPAAQSVDEILTQIRAEKDPAKRRQLFQQHRKALEAAKDSGSRA